LNTIIIDFIERYDLMNSYTGQLGVEARAGIIYIELTKK
jgi:hypothetical protein